MCTINFTKDEDLNFAFVLYNLVFSKKSGAAFSGVDIHKEMWDLMSEELVDDMLISDKLEKWYQAGLLERGNSSDSSGDTTLYHIHSRNLSLD